MSSTSPSRVSNIFTPPRPSEFAHPQLPSHRLFLSPRNKIDPKFLHSREYSSLTLIFFFSLQPDLVASSSKQQQQRQRSNERLVQPLPQENLLFLEQVGVCLVVAGQPHQRNRQAQPSHRSEIGPSSERGYMAVAGWMTRLRREEG